MKLQHKAWVLVFAIVLIAVAGTMLGVRHIVGGSFDQLQFDRAAREGERARRVLNQQLVALAATARDYAHWADAADFAAGRNPTFMLDNFDVSNMGYLRISEVLVFDPAGQLLASARQEAESLVEVPARRLESLSQLARPLVSGADPMAVLQTLRVHDGRLEFVVAVAIHYPDRLDQAPTGALVMVRHFDASELAQFSEILMTQTSLLLAPPGHVDEDFHLFAADDAHDVLHAVLRDHQGNPVAELVLRLDRLLQQQGLALAWQGMGLAVLAGLLVSLFLVLLLDRLLLRRLQHLHDDLGLVTQAGPLTSGSLRVDGNDELTRLAQGVNSLLGRVRQDAQAQRVAHEGQEVLQMQLMQSQKTEALGRLTGGIAHDFNNSLAAITGWVRLAAEDLPDPDHASQESLQQALKATRYADGLMRQLLAFGRQSAPKLRRMHLTNLIEETRQMMASGLARSCDIVVDYRVDDEEVDADATQLQQVLVNLLINASDAMKGQGRIDLILEEAELPQPAGQALLPGTAGLAPGRYLVLRVCDRGPGIEPALLDRVFEPFFTTKPKGRGTGLGLSVAQGILARHQGGLGVQSEPGQGACFHVYLPVSPRTSDVAPITGPGGPGEGHHILFVDDDQMVRHAWSALLERKGWLVTRARDGEEAWTHFKQSGKRFDVVLTDQSMPRLDGVGLAHRIVASEHAPPVVLISGHANEVQPELLEALFVAVLHKPVDTSEIDRVLKDVIRRHADVRAQV